MKQRFNALDIRATVTNLKERLTNLRLQNIYDVNAKTFLLKFAKPDDKELVLIESGTRIHSTQYSREKQVTPSAFCAKLRKYLRTRRVTNIRQLGVDRIVDFEFAGGEKSFGYHIIAEFYASGNIIFTDDKYKIIALLRVVNTEDTKMAVGETYDVQLAVTDFTKLETDKLQQVLRNAGPKDTLKKVLNIAYEYGPAMIEHIILKAGLSPNMKPATEFDSSIDSPMMQDLIKAFAEGDEMVESTKNNVPRGYIILLEDKKAPAKEGEEDDNRIEIYDEFHPYLYKQHESRPYKEFNTFDSAVDEFFSAIEAQKIELKARNQEEAAIKKLEAVRKEQENRVRMLVDQQTTNVRKAQLIELNLDMVEAAITIIRNAVASQMDWQDLNELVKEEKKRGNPIADIIGSLKLQTNQITLLLSEPDGYESEEDSSDEDTDSEEEDEEWPKGPVKVDVEIGLTAFANARKYYDQKRSTATKHEKTIKASSKAMKSAERKIRKDLKETKITTTINKIRKPFWFEKFLWFISTEGHLVIAGRDMQQNEILVKRYLHKDDVYVHADLHGAASVVVKNKPENAGNPIPPSTLFQAGIMSVCQSKAWDAKIVTSAYWVHADQVSKSAPTGEYLTTGSFMIRGKKNFLPPVQLVYGFGYLFKLDESSIGNHVSEKRQEEQDENEDVSNGDGLQAVGDEAVTPARSINESLTEETSDSVKEETTADRQSGDDDASSDSSSSEDEDEAFPDTQLAPTTTTTTDATAAAGTSTSATQKGPEWNKYDLDEYGANEDADALPSFAQPSKQVGNNKAGKQAISAKERRQLKKGKAGNESATQTKSNKASTSKEPVPAPQTQARGKRGKAKKIKQKYGDQDEEERKLRMELLGSNKGPQPKGKKAKKEAQAKAEKLAREKEREEQWAAAEAARAAEAANAQVDEAGIDNVDEIAADEGEDKETIRQMLKEENITMLEADEAANLSILDSVTPNPLPEDIIHFAVPVCAPYTALQKYKYKVKLTPGSLKRGKGLKQAHSVFLNLTDSTAREKELIKSVPDMEAINAMMSKVKVSAPNLEASKRKKGKK
ncbi:fibronectin-binding protein A N-terminus-domain-containing protein [Zychaea mexicana]|uniref:fibronectin-binding protein A N-terminus-domain-containing protein n=1 Tax=Zychaea mexicana TaxID=64656 RepID=UPI0022FE5790|nr:fibronectin-binding protein A N-terminus-domain-containing protein [Zychaea mexicana]KAI9492473.1 fibronectin-binding protein A N-terminus-domain-containing protein [Zychaea mexicana]